MKVSHYLSLSFSSFFSIFLRCLCIFLITVHHDKNLKMYSFIINAFVYTTVYIFSYTYSSIIKRHEFIIIHVIILKS